MSEIYSGADAFLDMLTTRFACKRYDSERKISDEDFDKIVEAARLSPTSFGLEAWKLLVIENDDIVAGIRERAWGVKKNAAKTCVLLVKRDLTADSPYVDHILTSVKQLSDEDKHARKDLFNSFQTDTFKLKDSADRFSWAQKQAYIVLTNMLNMAALLGIDSTPIEGFDPEKLEEYFVKLGLYNPSEWGVALLCQFGYASADHMEVKKTRRPQNEVVEYIK